jgi:hypothetical protein
MPPAQIEHAGVEWVSHQSNHLFYGVLEKISQEVGQIFLLGDHLLLGKADVVLPLYLKLDLREL